MRNLESLKESGGQSQESSGEVEEKENEKEGGKLSALKERLEKAKGRKAEQEKAEKEKMLQEKIEESVHLAEVKEKQKEQLNEARESLERVQEDLYGAQENLQKVEAELEEAQGILKEYLDLMEDSEEAKDEKGEMQKLVEEMQQTRKTLEKQAALLEEKRDELVSQIEALSQIIQGLEVEIEGIASEPEVAERLKKIEEAKAKAEEKERKGAEEEITLARQEIEKGQKALFEKIQKLAESIEHAKEMQRFTEKELQEIRPRAEKFLFSYSWWDAAGKELKTEAQEIFQRSDSPEEFAKGLSDLRENKYSGLGKGKARKAIDYALDLIQSNSNFQEWRDRLKNLESWQTEAQFPKDAVSELALKYSALIGAAWEVKRNHLKEGEGLPWEVYHGLQDMIKDKTAKDIVHAVLEKAGGVGIVYHDPLEK